MAIPFTQKPSTKIDLNKANYKNFITKYYKFRLVLATFILSIFKISVVIRVCGEKMLTGINFKSYPSNFGNSNKIYRFNNHTQSIKRETDLNVTFKGFINRWVNGDYLLKRLTTVRNVLEEKYPQEFFMLYKHNISLKVGGHKPVTTTMQEFTGKETFYINEDFLMTEKPEEIAFQIARKTRTYFEMDKVV